LKAYGIVQAFAIALIVAWSAWYAARRLVPTASRRAQAAIAAWLARPGHAAWLRRTGRRMRPVQAAAGGCGTSGCSACGACGSAARSARVAPSVAEASTARPLAFRQRAKS
jgi:hypothetical protein